MDGSQEKIRLTPEQIEAREAEERLIRRLTAQGDRRPRTDSKDWHRMLKEEIRSND